jgi:hypothetical protein
MTPKHASSLAAALLLPMLALAACDLRLGAADMGKPVPPTAANPTGSLGGTASGGGVPVPTRPGGSGGVGSGNQPGVGGGTAVGR